MKVMNRFARAAGVGLLLLASSVRADVVSDWNVTALRTTAAAPFNPPLESRNLAIVHAAIFDAVNAIGREFEPYAVWVEPARPVSPEAAASAAAHLALLRLYPRNRRASTLPTWHRLRQFPTDRRRSTESLSASLSPPGS